MRAIHTADIDLFSVEACGRVLSRASFVNRSPSPREARERTEIVDNVIGNGVAQTYDRSASDSMAGSGAT
jgi:hypothetical protein